MIDVETYIHRVGRTGRAGESGKGFIILAPQEKYLLPRLRSKNIPIKTVSSPSSSSPFISNAVAGFLAEDQENAKKVYQSWLGYYNSKTKDLGVDKYGLIELAAEFAVDVLGCTQAPILESKTIGKMGLKGFLAGSKSSNHHEGRSESARGGGGGRGKSRGGRGGNRGR